MAWELKCMYPEITEDILYMDEAKNLFDDANLMLDEIEEKFLIAASVVFGLFPANSHGDDIIIYSDEEGRS